MPQCFSQSQDGGNASAAFLSHKLDFDETLVCLDVLKSSDLTFAALCQVLFC